MKENFFEAKNFYERFVNLCGKVELTFNEEKNISFKYNDIVNFKRVYEYDLKRAENLHRKVYKVLTGKKNKGNYFHDINFFEKEEKPVCAAPFRTPIINWDGKVTVCCPDTELELSVGNLNDKSFKEIWFSKEMNIFRKAHLNKDLENYKRCSRCSGYFGKPLQKKEILMYNL
jgi:radical SAM protein with 4Fe4S-binding SPASM domain